MNGPAVCVALLVALAAFVWVMETTTPAPVTEQPAVKVSCVRVKHVADGGTIEYRCEVRK